MKKTQHNKGGKREGAGRPKSEPSTTITIRVKDSTLIKWRESVIKGENLNRFIVDACNKACAVK